MTKTLTLPSGKIAEIRKGRGYDLLQAQIKAKDSEEIPYALIAELASIDGQQLVYEDILDMDLEDVIALQTEISGKLQSAKAKKEDTKQSTSLSPTANALIILILNMVKVMKLKLYLKILKNYGKMLGFQVKAIIYDCISDMSGKNF